ncbi:glycosyltransferase [Candidatus Calescamantes bacterium]|nr:glycosyltransferase [Candidatus Calescamantes bacterium]
MKDKPFISIIIPVENGTNLSLSFFKNLKYPSSRFEIIVVEGENPSFQRNRGVEKAEGEIICFLDKDSHPSSDYLEEVARSFNFGKGNTPGAVGGPAIPLSSSHWMSILFSETLTSFFPLLWMRSRYKRRGKIRASDEKELIGCNLCVRKEVFQKIGGFNESLYPNEENEFLNRIKRKGYTILHNPSLMVYRKMEDGLRKFLNRFYRYGQGRGKEIRVEGLCPNFVYFLPFFLLLYVFSIFLFHPWWYLFPLFLYISLGGFSALFYSWKERKIYLLSLFPLSFLVHLIYALGMIKGVIASRNNTPKIWKTEVRKIKRFNDEITL